MFQERSDAKKKKVCPLAASQTDIRNFTYHLPICNKTCLNADAPTHLYKYLRGN